MPLTERGNMRDTINAIMTAVGSLSAVSSSRYRTFGPYELVEDMPVALGATLVTAGGELVQLADITAVGTYEIHRIRSGVDSKIVDTTACEAGLGRVFCTYTFPNASWDSGDISYVLIQGVEVDDGETTYEYPDIAVWGQIMDATALYSQVATVDEVVDAILEDTGTTLPAQIEDVGDDVAAVLEDTGTTLPAAIAALDTLIDGAITKIDTVDTVADAVKAQTDKLTFSTTNVYAILNTTEGTQLDNAELFARWAMAQLGDELISNPGLEGTYTGGLPANWNESDTGDVLIPSEETGDVYQGAKCLRLEKSASAVNTSVGSPIFSTIKGEWYLVSFALKVIQGSLRLVYFYAGDQTIAADLAPASWTYYTYLVKANTTSNSVRLRFYLTTTATADTVLLDSVSVRSISVSSVPDLIAGLNNLSSSDVTAAVTAVLGTAISSAPNAKSLKDILHKNSSCTYDKATDSLEAISDKLLAGFGWSADADKVALEEGTSAAFSMLSLLAYATAAIVDARGAAVSANSLLGLPGKIDNLGTALDNSMWAPSFSDASVTVAVADGEKDLFDTYYTHPYVIWNAGADMTSSGIGGGVTLTLRAYMYVNSNARKIGELAVSSIPTIPIVWVPFYSYAGAFGTMANNFPIVAARFKLTGQINSGSATFRALVGYSRVAGDSGSSW